MDNIHRTLSLVDAYAAENGVTPAWVVRKATGNPYLYDRLLKRAAQTDADLGKILALIEREATASQRAPSQTEPQGNASGTKRNDRVKRQQPKSEGTP